MAEIREYLAKNVYVPFRGAFSSVKKAIEKLLERLEDQGYDVRFDRQENGVVIYARDEQKKIRKVYAVVAKRKNRKLLSWLNSLGY